MLQHETEPIKAQHWAPRKKVLQFIIFKWFQTGQFINMVIIVKKGDSGYTFSSTWVKHEFSNSAMRLTESWQSASSTSVTSPTARWCVMLFPTVLHIIWQYIRTMCVHHTDTDGPPSVLAIFNNGWYLYHKGTGMGKIICYAWWQLKLSRLKSWRTMPL